MKKTSFLFDVPPPAMPFDGFTEETFKFLHGLKKNNNKIWFEKHRDSYETDLRGPCKLLVDVMAEHFADARMPLVASQKRSLFRINRDIRFSKDKSPYKTHIGIVFPQEGLKEDEWTGMYFGFEPDAKNGVKAYIGGGAYMPSSQFLKRIRKNIGANHKQLEKLLAEKKFRTQYPKGVTGESLKRMPNGYDEDHPAAKWLKMKSFTYGCDLSKKDLLDSKLPKLLLMKFGAALSVMRFLSES